MKKKKPKICIVTYFHCLRNIKLAIGTSNLGYELELITRMEGMTLMKEMDFLHIYDNVRIWETPSQLESILQKSNADIFWVHNEPDLMTEFAVQEHIKKGRVVIHDCHDLPSLHQKPQTCPTCKTPTLRQMTELGEQEKIAIEQSDFVFVPTKSYEEIIKLKYGEKAGGKSITVYSCPPKMFFPETDLPRVNGLLYCGQVNVPEMKSNLHFRDMLPLFHKMLQLGIPTHLYHTTPGINLQSYITAGANVHGTMKMWAAMHQYTRYDYGFVGSSENCKQIQVCMPNKLFDCMAAGIPLVVLNAKDAGDFCLERKIGVSAQGIEAFNRIPWHNKAFWDERRENVRKIRYEYTAENEVKKAFERIGI